MASKSLIRGNTRFSKFREHVRRWAFERTKDDALKIVMRDFYGQIFIVGKRNPCLIRISRLL